MIESGSYVICDKPGTRFHKCVFKVDSVVSSSDIYGYIEINVVDEARRNDEWHSLMRLDSYAGLREISEDDPEFPQDLLDQPIYKVASDYFDVGDIVEVHQPDFEPFRARVYKTYLGDWEHEDAFVSVIRIDDNIPSDADRHILPVGTPVIGKCYRIRWDFLTLIKSAKDNEQDGPYGHVRDYLSDELLGTGALALYAHHNELIGWISEERVQQGIVATCHECGQTMFTNRSWMVQIDGVLVCHNCMNTHYIECDECGRTIHISEAIPGDDDCMYCRQCAENLDIVETGLRSYGYKPFPIFHGMGVVDDPDTLYMGVELEIDRGNNRDECVDDLRELDPDSQLMYFKQDGSLGCTGIEVVTHPCTLEYHKAMFPWHDVIRTALDYNYTSHDARTCGLHVHVNRTALGHTREEQDNTAARIVLIFDKFWSDFVRFSRRGWNGLGYSFQPNAGISPEDTQLIAIMKSKNMCEEHYCAVNLSNENTVEFRIFRGTLKYNTIIASLEMVSNVVSFAKAHTLEEIQTCVWSDLIQTNAYPELVSYLIERGMLTADTTAE